jgi:16S rRNA (cytosine967-C5)-methyltransferase
VSVHLAVDAARALGLQRATGFVNAVLRRFVRERESLLAAVDSDTATRHAHPEWFVSSVISAWPEAAETIFIANNQHPPMTLRVAPFSRHAREEYQRELASSGRMAHPLEWCDEALQLEHAVSVSSLPGFESGRVSVQDAGAQLAAHLLDLHAGQRVLDACAAPGGKTAHILQRQPDIDLLAVDVDGERMALVKGTLERIGVKARVSVRDLSRSDALADEAPFDRILLDAPCSSTGVIRRHPDIKLLRRAEDIQHLARMQRRLLENCFSMLAPQGRLVYATCSVLPDENEQVIQAFVESHPEIEALPWPAEVRLPPGAIRLRYGVQLLPGSAADTDGFYYACLGYRGSR